MTAQNNKTEVTLVSSEHGFRDFDVANLPGVHRVCIGHNIKKGDIFNVYCSGDVKLGASWCGEVKQSLAHFTATHEQYRQRFGADKRNPTLDEAWAEFGASLGEFGRMESPEEFDEFCKQNGYPYTYLSEQCQAQTG